MADSGNSDIDMNNSEIKKIGGIEMNYDNDSEIDMKNNKITDVGGIVMYNDDDSKINMNGNKIINLDAPSGDNHAANKKSVDDKISEIPVGDSSGLLPLDGSKAMTGDLNMGTKSIINLADPTANSHGANKKSVDGKIEASEKASIRAVQQENVFARVVKNDDFKEDDDDIHKVGSVQKDFHQVNHQTYQFKIDYDSSIGYHSTRLSIDLIYLPLGSYTMVYEMYIEDGITIDEINAVSGTLNVVKINSKIYGTNTRSIIHFTKSFFSSVFDDLEIDIKLKSKTDPQTTIYVVVYGVSGYQNNVDPLVWDRFYYIENKIVHFEAPIDMNGNKITGVAAGVDDSDVINKAQFDKIQTYYYYTNDLKHNNQKNVNFPNFNKYPFDSNLKEIINIKLSGYYHIIYTDYYKRKNGTFRIHKNTTPIYLLPVNTKSDWTQLTINTVHKFENGDYLQFDFSNNRTCLFGIGRSTFYIKYLHP